jgi:adenylate kinase family enzyme
VGLSRLSEGLRHTVNSHQAPGRRVCVVGTSGSGKTFVAKALAEDLGLTYICNDAIIWRGNWQPSTDSERQAAIDAATRANGWTFDGNLSLNRPEDQMALERCDTLVWLDLPRWQTHWQVTRRTLGRVITQEPLWHGNTESWRTMLSGDSIIWWSIKTFGRRRREYAELFRDPALARLRRIRLRSRGELDRWLAAIPTPGR